MSRYRDDRDDDFYVDRSRARRGGGGGYDEDRLSERERGGYGGSSTDDRRGGDYGARRDYEDYGRRRSSSGGYGGGGDRDDYRDERSDNYGAARRDYDERDRPRRDYEDDREGRSIFEEGRDFFRGRRRGGGGGREEGQRGATRSHVRCRDIMTRDVTVATRDTTLEEVARLMKNEDTGVIPVVDRAETPINTRPPNEVAATAAATGVDAPVGTSPEARRVPIVDQDRTLRGIISMADVALETNDDRELAEALEEISSGSSFWNRIFG
jgi:CBS domain-containing protein